MTRFKPTRPSPALVISVIALFVALGGSALAATAITSKKDVNNKGNLTNQAVDTNNIAGKAVTAKKLAPGAAKKGKIADGAVSSSKIADGAVSSSKIGDESVGAEKLGSITKVSETSPPAVVPPITATATCPDGSKVVGGGYSTAPPYDPNDGIPGAVVNKSERSNNGWRADAMATEFGDTVTANAYCLESNG